MQQIRERPAVGPRSCGTGARPATTRTRSTYVLLYPMGIRRGSVRAYPTTRRALGVVSLANRLPLLSDFERAVGTTK